MSAHPTKNVCVPAEHNLDEIELLLNELQLRMTNAVLSSTRYEQCLRSSHELYCVLAEFFESQRVEAQQAADVALSPTEVRRIWAYCFGVIELHRQQADGGSGRDADTTSNALDELHSFLARRPAVPLEALQQPAPTVASNERLVGKLNEIDASSSMMTRRSLFSLVRSVLPSLMELCYTVDLRLQHISSSSLPSSASLSVLSFAALTASLVPTLDRVQAVRWTAQLADDLWDAQVIKTADESQQRFSFKTIVLLLAGVWWVWSTLDVEHTPVLRKLAELLVVEADAPATSNDASAQVPSMWSSSSFFTLWFQDALRRNAGALHQQLYSSPIHESEGVHAGHVTHKSGTATEGKWDLSGCEPSGSGGGEAASAVTEDAAKAAGKDFWAQLAS
ncbi:hypothetical protein ABL78_4869 [Leptomonas seymouri]|uniref:Uncharacterized protein n=1 Tax=Leptomonas seymouri TaxID=5684 RepID=A0A0N0P5J7_LEPSE|nr:hypothetical protein ABL78_4869 [Leptomonas seymouri]|eukprot:KPI86067.1 hypothetical protein ABL78_4869 [Leptomonas seymouri]